MMKKVFGLLLSLFMFYYLTGCAPTYYTQGRKSMEIEDYDTAIEYFEMALKKNPNDQKALRELGIVYYSRIEFDKAFPYLIQAFLQDSTDGRTLFYLGTAYEITKDYRHAIDIYRRYTQVSRLESIRNSIEARLNRLVLGELEKESRALMEQEETLDVSSIPENTVAVLYFQNMGEKRDLDPLQKGIADMLITDLSKVRALRVVERMRMQKLVEEMALGVTGLVDDQSAPRVGRLLGASNLVKGTYLDLSALELRINAGLINTGIEMSVQSEYVTGELARLFMLEKDLVFKIIDGMGIELTQKERDEIEIIPTESLLAFMAYCRGMDYEDRGMYSQAAEEYAKAAELDPKYTAAKKKQTLTESMAAESEMEISELVNTFMALTGTLPQPREARAAEPVEPVAEEEVTELPVEPVVQADWLGSRSILDHMFHTGEVGSQGLLPGIDSRNPAQEQSQTSFGNSAAFEIEIPLPLGKRR